ncbi:hypothetical protein YA0599_13485 [Pseudomonas syringae]|uniref:DUF6602 domain-containing protein n=1 Tax=Pseudomonas syringae TaxID=317 RepID=UPI0018E63A42|nr:DUF6602 domain-containing protein [Pseudomonas syringae]MBI6709239.1 hypothetical protein [Pseudomonas syringae]
MITKSIVQALNKSVLDDLDLTRQIKHPGENGRAREQILRDFLKKIIPKRFSIDTGFIIDATGGISNQIDLVIYRDDYHSVLEIGGIKHFMVEAVVAVIENKASIASSATLRQALQNIRSVKSLDRSNQGSNYTVPMREKIDKNKLYHQVFGAILTEKSLTPENLRLVFQEYFETTKDKNLWPNMYCDVRGSSFRYVDQKERVVVDPRSAVAFSISDPTAETYNPPLIELAYELVSIFRVLPLIDFSAQDYFHGISGRAKEYVAFPPSMWG